MSGVSRFDFFRIVVPGAAVVSLAWLVAKTVLLTPLVRDLDALDQFAGFIGSPFRGAVAAFGAGLILYLLDPAYRAPQFWRRIPSTHLRRVLEERGITDANHVSLNFVVMDQFMPGPLQERAYLYGAIYRLGFQLVVYLLVAGASLPVLVWAASPHELELGPRFVSFAGIGFVVAAVGIPFLGQLWRASRDRSTPLGWRRDAIVVALGSAIVSVTFWVLVWHGWPRWVGGLPVFVVLVWAFVRHTGPVAGWWQWMTDRHAQRPDVPHRPREVMAMDLGLTTLGLGGMFTLGRATSGVQIAVIAGLLTSGLLLGFVRKFERQLFGIYRNQALWIDANLDRIIDVHMAAKDEG